MKNTMIRKLTVILVLLVLPLCVFSYNVGNPGKGRKHFTYKHVIVVGIDGMGAFGRNTDTPNMDRIFAKGACTFSAKAVDPTSSGENWTSITTGVLPYYHKVGNHNIGSRPYTSDKYPTVFRMVRRAFPKDPIGSFLDWTVLNSGMVEDGIGVDKGNYNMTQEPLEADEAEKYIIEKKPRLFFVYFANVDETAHVHGWGSEEHYAEIRTADGYVGRMYRAVEEAGIADDTLFVVVTDHGGVDKGHGGISDAERNVFFGVRGKTVIPGSDLGTMCSRDLPAIVCYALGIEGNPLWDSYLPKGLFEDYPNPPYRKAGPAEAAVHKALPTPAIDGEKGLSRYVDMSKLKYACFFDGSHEPQAGEWKGDFTGAEAYGSGWYGKAVRLNWDSFFALPELKLGTGSFAVSMWMKPLNDGVSQPPVFCNKDWETGYNRGFIVARYGTGIKFNAGNGGDGRCDYLYNMPYGFTGRWTNVLISVDREAATVAFYVNFEEMGREKLGPELRDISFDSGLPFTIGRDANGHDPSFMDYYADDLLIFDKALEQEEINRLKEYYGCK